MRSSQRSCFTNCFAFGFYQMFFSLFLFRERKKAHTHTHVYIYSRTLSNQGLHLFDFIIIHIDLNDLNVNFTIRFALSVYLCTLHTLQYHCNCVNCTEFSREEKRKQKKARVVRSTKNNLTQFLLRFHFRFVLFFCLSISFDLLAFYRWFSTSKIYICNSLWYVC